MWQLEAFRPEFGQNATYFGELTFSTQIKLIEDVET